MASRSFGKNQVQKQPENKTEKPNSQIRLEKKSEKIPENRSVKNKEKISDEQPEKKSQIQSKKKSEQLPETQNVVDEDTMVELLQREKTNEHESEPLLEDETAKGQNIDDFIGSIKKGEEKKIKVKTRKTFIISTELEPIKIDQELETFLKSVLIQ